MSTRCSSNSRRKRGHRSVHQLKAAPRFRLSLQKLGPNFFERIRSSMSQQITLSAAAAGTFTIGGDLTVNRIGYGAMRITGPGIWGPPADKKAELATLRKAIELGVNLIDTADSYGPGISPKRWMGASSDCVWSPSTFINSTRPTMSSHSRLQWKRWPDCASKARS